MILRILKNGAENWYDIAYGITRAHGLAANKIRVSGAGTGSLFLELATEPEVVLTTFGLIVLLSLEVTERVLNIRKRAAEVRGLEIDNKYKEKIAKQLDEEADKLKKEEAKVIVEKVVVKFNITKEGDGDEGNYLKRSVRKLLDFLDKGGEIDTWIPDEEEREELSEDQQRLRSEARETWREVRQLESRLRLLEDQSDKGNSQDSELEKEDDN